MSVDDKSSSVDPRIRRTERAVVAAARVLFERQGYAATTMSQIAQEADCAERTLFLRFSSKAELLKRVVDQTFRGPVDAGHHESTGQREVAAEQPAGESLESRLRAFAAGVADTMIRTGPLFAVAREAEASEPLIAAAFDAARRDTIAASHRMWEGLARDGLISADVDVAWVADTTGLLASADAYLLMRTAIGWDRIQLEEWLLRTWLHFASPNGPGPAA
ncbi:TetR/AcrR family transcriptional regulator [Paenarthrobacter sp. NPDC091711]|uniref:TetR/AcrR family transcriptional regulator n=1 Tax=Micrococcaceae TaxID=1268 RepID=UPI0008993DF5|nr:TetR/AcrR family transcriptional regulator [Arthrobacter sp. cf158]SDX32994.1 transcriptional regulator, TetR family [Arthrobacter sp. cf158]